MRFWTSQRHEIATALLSGVPISPNWEKSRPSGGQGEAYLYLLAQYQQKYERDSAGLVFGYAGYKNLRSLVSAINRAGIPGGSVYPPETHSILEFEIPDSMPVLKVDYYRFSDLIFCYEDDDGTLTLEEAKRDLFLPNGSGGKWELPVAHVPYLLPAWLRGLHDSPFKLGL